MASSLAERETRGATIREAFTEAATWVREISESYNIAVSTILSTSRLPLG